MRRLAGRIRLRIAAYDKYPKYQGLDFKTEIAMNLDKLWIRMGIGKRDRFWLAIAIAVVTILFILRWTSRNGFSDSGAPVWKSAQLWRDSVNSTLPKVANHDASSHPIHP